VKAGVKVDARVELLAVERDAPKEHQRERKRGSLYWEVLKEKS